MVRHMCKQREGYELPATMTVFVFERFHKYNGVCVPRVPPEWPATRLSIVQSVFRIVSCVFCSLAVRVLPLLRRLYVLLQFVFAEGLAVYTVPTHNHNHNHTFFC